MNNKLLNRIISISLCVITILLGALFILQTIRLNNNFSKQLIGRVLLQILPIIILWVVVFVFSLFTRGENVKSHVKPRYIGKKISKKSYLILSIAYFLTVLVCAFFTVAYLVQSKHFTVEFNETMLSFFYYLLPFAGIAFVFTLIRSFFVPTEEINLVKIDQKKKLLIINICRVVLLTTTIVLIVVGLVNNQSESVLTKAISICLECVGIG